MSRVLCDSSSSRLGHIRDVFATSSTRTAPRLHRYRNHEVCNRRVGYASQVSSSSGALPTAESSAFITCVSALRVAPFRFFILAPGRTRTELCSYTIAQDALMTHVRCRPRRLCVACTRR